MMIHSNSHSKRTPWAALSLLGVALGVGLLLFTGCSSAPKKTETKELNELALNSKEEAQKMRDQGNLQAAVAKYQESLRYYPSPSVHAELGDVLTKLNRDTEARQQYELALAKNPGMPEATDALGRLEAKMDLEDGSRPGGPTTPRERVASGGSSESGSDRAASANPEVVAAEVFDEDRVFNELSEIQPPRDSAPTRSAQDVSVFDDEESASSLMRDTESLYGDGRGSSSVSTDSAFADSEKDLQPSSTRRKLPPTTTKGLKGGRGLIGGSGGADPIALRESRGSVDSAVANTANLELRSGSDDRTRYDVTSLAGRPGERGLKPSSRLPSVAPLPPAGLRTEVPEDVEPAFNLPEEKRTTTKPLVERSRERPKLGGNEPEEEDKGFLDRITGNDEITYPEPPQPEAEQALPSTYSTDKEKLDLRPFRVERLKGRTIPELDFQVCKDRYYKEKDLEGAIRCFSDKRLDFPEDPILYYELALILEDAGDYSLARKNLEMAIRYDAGNQDYRTALARLDVGKARQHRTAGEYLQAVRVLQNTIKQYPDMVEAYRELGLTYSSSAVARMNAIDKGSPNTEQTQEIILNEWINAEGAYQDLVSRTDASYKDWYNLGLAIQQQNNDKKRTSAIKAYEKAIELRPDYGNAHYHLGILYEGSNVSKAETHYQKALSLARSSTDQENRDLLVKCLGSLGELNWRIGNKEKAAEYLTEYIQHAPNDAYIEEMLSQITSEPL